MKSKKFYLPYQTKQSNWQREKRLFSCAESDDIKKRMLLILGQPGMGKSTLITWFVNQYMEKGDSTRKVFV